MWVKVLYFGLLKERLGVAEERLELPEGATVADLLRLFQVRTSKSPTGDGDLEIEGLWRSLAVAVNQEYGNTSMVLREDDEVALLPPVSGGRQRPEQIRGNFGARAGREVIERAGRC